MRQRATAFAPASCGNVASGFDVLGLALEGLGDTVTAERRRDPGVEIAALTGIVQDLPTDPQRNTAGRAVASLLLAQAADFGVRLSIAKGIPLGSGLGGSAASAVAALVACNALLTSPLPPVGLYPHALEGESASSGARHGDNVGPQLLGGLVLTTESRCLRLPTPPGWHAVVVHPDQVLETRVARAVLAEPFPLATVVAQTAALAQLLVGLQRADPELVREGLRDALVEPRRAALIPGFAAAKAAALAAGALGASISGAGPSCFAWTLDRAHAEEVGRAMVAAFAACGIAARAYPSSLSAPGARLLPEGGEAAA